MKQQLAGVRMLFDWLVVGQVMPHNPTAAVRGPKYSSAKGKTHMPTRDEAKALLANIDTASLIGLRDRALIAYCSTPSPASTRRPACGSKTSIR